MNWKWRLGMFAFGGYVLAQGIGNLNAHHYAYWNVSRRFVLYPETQIIAGGAIVLFSVVPLGALLKRLTARFFEHRHPLIKPFWKRRHLHTDSPE
jgi:hypothetical protein